MQKLKMFDKENIKWFNNYKGGQSYRNWAVCVIEEIFPGNDGIIRVVSIKTKRGISKKLISKIWFPHFLIRLYIFY